MELNFDILKEMIDCAGRELGLRKRCYPKWVASGRMKEETAQNEIRLMRLIYLSLKKIYDKKVPAIQQTLFNSNDFKTKTHWN